MFLVLVISEHYFLFHMKYLLFSFHTYQGDVYPVQSHFWVNKGVIYV